LGCKLLYSVPPASYNYSQLLTFVLSNPTLSARNKGLISLYCPIAVHYQIYNLGIGVSH
jgi:hypothetical protein